MDLGKKLKKVSSSVILKIKLIYSSLINNALMNKYKSISTINNIILIDLGFNGSIRKKVFNIICFIFNLSKKNSTKFLLRLQKFHISI